jgi:hypothetical protein
MKRIVVFVVLLFSTTSAICQSEYVFDAGMWNTLSIQYQFKKKFSLNLDQEFRIKENYSRLNLLYTNIGVSYKATKFLKIEPSYRHIDKFLLDGRISFRHRLMLDVTLKKKFGNFTISERARYQTEVKNVLSSDRAWSAEQYLRMRTELDYEINYTYEVSYSCEFRYQIYVPGNDVVFNNTWHRMRNVVGVNINFNKRNILNLYYLFQNEFNIDNPENISIAGVQYTIKL